MPETTVTVMENLGTNTATAIDSISTIMGDALELAVNNPLVMLFVGAGLVGLGIGLFHKLKAIAG